MKAFVWLMKIPRLAWFFFRVLLPLWNVLWSNLEAIFHIHKRRVSINVLNALNFNLTSASPLAQWYHAKSFRWREDLFGGLLDFSSKPWVSVARNCGDCDDMMLIAEHVLQGKFDENHRCYVYASDGRSHAIYLVRAGMVWFVMSNQNLEGSFQSREAAVEHTFGEMTTFYYII